jgi:hypothetical protein
MNDNAPNQVFTTLLYWVRFQKDDKDAALTLKKTPHNLAFPSTFNFLIHVDTRWINASTAGQG